jgi:hypothetical protein
MGGFSIWHWLIVLFFFVIPLGVAAVAIRSKKEVSPMDRKAFSLRILALLGVNFVLGFVLPSEPWAQGVSALAGIVGIAFVAYWAVDRFHDLGAAKNKAFLTAVPLLGLVVIVYLMVRKGHGGIPATVEAAGHGA